MMSLHIVGSAYTLINIPEFSSDIVLYRLLVSSSFMT